MDSIIPKYGVRSLLSNTTNIIIIVIIQIHNKFGFSTVYFKCILPSNVHFKYIITGNDVSA